MKEDELRQNAYCNLCERRIGESGFPIFFTVKVSRYVLNLEALKRQQGLTDFLGGSAELARVMGTDEDLAYQMGEGTLTICMDCSSSFDNSIADTIGKALSKYDEDEFGDGE